MWFYGDSIGFSFSNGADEGRQEEPKRTSGFISKVLFVCLMSLSGIFVCIERSPFTAFCKANLFGKVILANTILSFYYPVGITGTNGPKIKFPARHCGHFCFFKKPLKNFVIDSAFIFTCPTFSISCLHTPSSVFLIRFAMNPK